MKRIPQSFIDELHNRLDIVDIIDSRVKLKKTGKNYSACCPFHKEKTPSFTVSPDKQFYYCFGCGATGTALSFVIEHDNLDFVPAVENLAKIAGLEVPREDDGKKEFRHETNSLYSLLEKADAYYQLQLRDNPKRLEAVNYLKGRGLTGRTAKAYGVGYAPPGWDNLLKKLGLTKKDQDLLEQAGLVVINKDENKQYDRFRHRIMFPILDIRGRVIGFGGRILDAPTPATREAKNTKGSGPKYLNSPETPVFHKGRELYGLYQARKANRHLDHLLVVEGYMDVIALGQYNINTAVATLGTACGEDHLKLAFRFTSQIIFCFDGDNAGRKAAKRALENALSSMSDGRQIRFLFLPEGQDPDTQVRQVGTERFLEQVEQAIPLEEFFFDAVGEGINTQTMEGRASLSKAAAPFLHRLPNGVFRELMFDMLARRTGLSLDVLQELITIEPKPSPTVPPTTATSSNKADNTHTTEYNSEHSPSLHPESAPRKIGTPTYSHKDNATSQHIPEKGTVSPPFLAAKSSRASIRSPVKLPAARLAATILLQSPELLTQLEDSQIPENSDCVEVQRLGALVEYLRSRPHSSFHSIIGYWGGAFGMNSQRELTELVANQILGNAQKNDRFDALKELKDAFSTLHREMRKTTHLDEVSRRTQTISAKDFADMSPEEKQQLLQLINSKPTDTNTDPAR